MFKIIESQNISAQSLLIYFKLTFYDELKCDVNFRYLSIYGHPDLVGSAF